MNELYLALGTVVGGLIGAAATLVTRRQTIAATEAQLRRAEQREVDDLLKRYRDPLIRAAFDLQSRIYNIVSIGFLRRYLVDGAPAEKRYARESTLYLVAEYFGWVEVLRREVQFLDTGRDDQNRSITERIDRVREVFLTDLYDPTFRLFRGEQRAIGELMMTVNAREERECIGFATFVASYNAGRFGHWFEGLNGDIDLLATQLDVHLERLVEIQHALMDLLDLLDPDHLRFASSQRRRIVL